MENRGALTVRYADAVVVGSGCAGWCTAQCLQSLGVQTVLVTEDVDMGTSRNAGSDKQTYYKISLAGDESDSVMEMARDLYAGGGMDGDLALCQAALSARAFYRLCELGVPFPCDGFGQYPGYRTDHDLRGRATSAGPLTSRYMTRALEDAARQSGVQVLDRLGVVDLIVRDGHCAGVLALKLDEMGESGEGAPMTAILAGAVVLCTGGSAICYEDSVYPRSQTGMIGMALRAGAVGANLDQWQYGLASTDFRWNVSGSYQQVLPRYVSVDEGGREREFLAEALGEREALRLTFLKGYQWPFDAARAEESSRVDLLVYREAREKGRAVFLDFCRDPRGLEAGFDLLEDEARTYLEKSGALTDTPIRRLERMNPQAIQLYLNNGIDLAKEKLKIAVCAQHMNGGLLVDAHWQSTIKNLYAAGECAGTFGARRPGGSALNATQVGALRAAEHIARVRVKPVLFDPSPWAEAVRTRLTPTRKNGPDAVYYQGRMSRCAAFRRNLSGMRRLEEEIGETLSSFHGGRMSNPYQTGKTWDMLNTQAALLSAMLKSGRRYGTRGSALIIDGQTVPSTENLVLETRFSDGCYCSHFRPVRPIPQGDLWFENVWREYRERNCLP